MNQIILLKRITINPRILDGKLAIREKLAVEQLLEHLASGETFEALLEKYPWLESEDIQACLLYARQLIIEDQEDPRHQQPKNLGDLITEIPQILEQVPYLTLLVLFGSRARGDHDAYSDWDFAFLCDEELRKQYEKGGLDSYRIWGILQQIYNLDDDQIDAVDLKNCSDTLAHFIAEDGQVIYEQKSGIFLELKDKKLMSVEQLKIIKRKSRENTRQILQELKQQ